MMMVASMTKKTQERQASMLPQGKPQLPTKLRVPLVPRERTAGEFSLMCRCAGDCPGAGDCECLLGVGVGWCRCPGVQVLVMRNLSGVAST